MDSHYEVSQRRLEAGWWTGRERRKSLNTVIYKLKPNSELLPERGLDRDHIYSEHREYGKPFR